MHFAGLAQQYNARAPCTERAHTLAFVGYWLHAISGCFALAALAEAALALSLASLMAL